MEYYTMTNATGKAIGRSYPQLHCSTQYHAHRLISWEFPTFEPELKFELYKGALLTDVLSTAAISARGFMVSPMAREIIQHFNLMQHRYYAATILQPKTGQIFTYYWLHLCQPGLTEQLDYRRSTFYETAWTFREKGISLDSLEHYRDLKASDKEAKFGVEIDEIYLGQDFDTSLDLFSLLPFSSDIFISKRFKESLEGHKVSGLEFHPTGKIKLHDQKLYP